MKTMILNAFGTITEGKVNVGSGITFADPFDGIGSTGYQALKMGRRHIGVELKESYFRQAAMNLATAESEYFNQEAEQ